MRESHRLAGVQTPVIPVIAELIRQNPGTISLGQGVVHYGPPPEAVAAIQTFLADPENHKYRPVQGIPQLLDVVQDKLAAENGIANSAENAAIVTAGANMAFQTAIEAIADPGDEVILQTPYYFNHEMAIRITGCHPIDVPTDSHYQLQLDRIEAAITHRTRAIVTISPNNPTGAVYPESALRAVNEMCRQRSLYHIHDEAYEYFTYDEARHFSPGSIPGSETHTISLFSLSKSYGLASWRIGYMAAPAHLLTALKKILDTVLICPPVISQHVAVGALRAGKGYCEAHKPSIVSNRAMMLSALTDLGERCTVPAADGAFYLLLKVDSLLDPMTVAERLIQEYGVAVLPGSTFGITDGCYLRVSYGALTHDSAEEGIERLIRGLRSIRP